MMAISVLTCGRSGCVGGGVRGRCGAGRAAAAARQPPPATVPAPAVCPGRCAHVCGDIELHGGVVQRRIHRLQAQGRAGQGRAGRGAQAAAPGQPQRLRYSAAAAPAASELRLQHREARCSAAPWTGAARAWARCAELSTTHAPGGCPPWHGSFPPQTPCAPPHQSVHQQGDGGRREGTEKQPQPQPQPQPQQQPQQVAPPRPRRRRDAALGPTLTARWMAACSSSSSMSVLLVMPPSRRTARSIAPSSLARSSCFGGSLTDGAASLAAAAAGLPRPPRPLRRSAAGRCGRAALQHGRAAAAAGRLRGAAGTCALSSHGKVQRAVADMGVIARTGCVGGNECRWHLPERHKPGR